MIDIITFILISCLCHNDCGLRHRSYDTLLKVANATNIEQQLYYYMTFHPSLDVRVGCGRLADTYFDYSKMPLITSCRISIKDLEDILGASLEFWIDPRNKRQNERYLRDSTAKWIRERLLNGERWEDLRWEIREGLNSPNEQLDETIPLEPQECP